MLLLLKWNSTDCHFQIIQVFYIWMGGGYSVMFTVLKMNTLLDFLSDEEENEDPGDRQIPTG